MKTSLESFNDLVKQQFVYGGQKYKFSNTKESTDELFDIYTSNWLFGTCHKYILRFFNTTRERDLLKIATYCFIIWLKRGYHASAVGLANPVETTVEIKNQYYPDFILGAMNYYEKNQFYLDKLLASDSLSKIGNMFKCFAYGNWDDVSDEKLFHIYSLAFVAWDYHFYSLGKAGQDADTNNEEELLKKKLLDSAVLFFEGTEWTEEDLVLLVKNQLNAINKKDTNS